jgi:DNA-binding NarL/FixJ family response regulator
MPNYQKIKRRILLVEDHPMSRMGLKMMIEGEKDLCVCDEVDNAGSALDAAVRLLPDLVISDVSLPGRSGFELVQDLRAACPDVPVLILSMHSEKTYARRSLEVGARGYIMKSSDSATILAAVRTVLSGRISVSPAIAGQLLEFFADQSKHKKTGIETLTPREFEVFKFIAEGASTHVIATRLNMSPKTVDSHRSNIKQKLNAATMNQLTAQAAGWFAMQSMAELPESAKVA